MPRFRLRLAASIVLALIAALTARGQSSFRGFYTGISSNNAQVSIYISSNNDITTIVQERGSNSNFGALDTVKVAADGKFSFDYSLARVTGQVFADGRLTGDVKLYGWTFSLLRAPLTGPVEKYAGAYGGWVFDPNGRLLNFWGMVTTEGQFSIYIKDGPNVTETGVGTMDARGFFSFTDAAGGTSSGSVQSSFAGGSLNGRYFKSGSGAYTFVVTKESSSHRLSNLSTRAAVGSGAGVLIVGFTVANGAKTLLIRAVGPTLAQFNVPGELTDPRLSVFSGQTIVAANDNWGDNANASEISTISARLNAFALPNGSLDAALLLRLENGGYTAQVSGVSNFTGISLIEIYEVD